MTESFIDTLKALDDFEAIKGLYNITIDKREQLKYVQESLQNIIVTSPENIDTYDKIKMACFEYLGQEPPAPIVSRTSSRNITPISSRNVTPLSSRNVTPASVTPTRVTPRPLGTSLNAVLTPSPLPVPPQRTTQPTGPLAQLKVRPPASSITPPSITPPIESSVESASSSASTPVSRPPSTAVSRPESTARPARTLLKGGPDRAPILRQASTIPEITPASTKPTVVVTDKFFNITVNGITLTLKRTSELTEEIIRKNIDLFSYYLNGIVINSDKNSTLAKMLYAAVDKTNFETKTYTPPNNTENEYIWLVPK
jgi:hypothetical protein